jgi:ABC-type branched-subunit amino acid transport system ATPase component/ABC-type branched-subunit amino acid transport system permease subunit
VNHRRAPLTVAAAAVAVAVVLPSVLRPDDYPLGVTLQGALLGAGTGLMAVGLVLTYRSTRIINFAHGAMGTFAGGIAVGLKVGRGVPWALAAPLGVLLGVVVGALVERLVIRRFAEAPRLVLTVATIGLAQLLGGAAILIPGWFDLPTVVPGFSTTLSDTQIDLDPVRFDGNDLVYPVVIPLVLAGLSWFLLRTEAGTAVRGMAENMDRARLLGIPVNRLSLLLWSIAGGLSALTMVLQAPNRGIPLDVAAGPQFLLAALAAAVVSGLSSLSGAFVAGVGLGVLDQLVQWRLSDRVEVTPVVFLVVIVVALLLRRRTTSRALLAEESSWAPLGVPRKLPPALRRLPSIRVAKLLFGALVVATAVGLPQFGSDYQINQGTIALTYCMAALSLVVLTGWGGVVSLGQFALVGVGGVTAANLIADSDMDLAVVLPASALAGGLVALVVGVPALRVSGQMLAVTTMAFAVAMELYFLNPANYPAWLPNDVTRPEPLGLVDLSEERWLYGLALVLVVIVAGLTANLRRGRPGRTISATRDNERGAAAVGINPVETRLAAFVFAGMFAGLAGAIHAVTLQGLSLRTYPTSTSLLLFSMVVIGGAASIGGALSGVLLVQLLGYFFPRYQVLFAGVGLLVILMLVPGGLGQAVEGVRDRIANRAARRRGIPVVEELETIEQPVAPAAAELPFAASPQSDWEAAGTLLRCEGVESSYGALQVLFGIDTAVGDGEMVAILGTNGAGKSTLLKSLAGLLPPDRGRVVFAGRDIAGLPAERVARLGLSLMPGSRGVFPTLTVNENLRLATWMLRRERAAAAEALDDALTLFPILRERGSQRAGDLSGGEQQQLSLAMAFVTRPRLLCIDELSLGLAPTIVGQLVDKVREIHRAGSTVVVVEQSVNVAQLLCERAVFLEKGQVRFRGPTVGLLDEPEVVRAVFLGQADDVRVSVPVDGVDSPTHAKGQVEGPSGPAPLAPRAGKPAWLDLSAAPPPSPRKGDLSADLLGEGRDITLECQALVKRFGGINAVDGIDLVVRPAQVVGLIGHNGAGKTTLFDVLTGFLRADSGRVFLDGRDITDWPPHKRSGLALGRSFQEARLFPSLTVATALAVAYECQLENRDPLSAALRLPAAARSERRAYERVDELLALLGLEWCRDCLTSELSTGMRRIVELGCLLAHDPAVVLLDEPSAGIAQREAEALGPLLRRVQAQTGCSMVVIEHDMALLSGLCDEMVALEQGRVIAQGPPEAVLAADRVVASYLGTDQNVVQRSGSRVG